MFQKDSMKLSYRKYGKCCVCATNRIPLSEGLTKQGATCVRNDIEKQNS